MDDHVMPSVDFYEFYKWAMRKVQKDEELRRDTFCINAYQHWSRSESDPFEFSWYSFTTWGFAVSRVRNCSSYFIFCVIVCQELWPAIKASWPFFHGHHDSMEELRRRMGRHCLKPRLSRVRYIRFAFVRCVHIRKVRWAETSEC